MIACFTESGRTASLVAKYRPTAPLIAFCHQEAPRLRLALTWGVETVSMTHVHEVEQMVQAVEARLVETEQVRAGDRVVIVFGAPFGVSGSTNSIRLHTIGR